MIARLLKIALWCVSIGSALTFLRLVLRRFGYPLELDCIEGVMMDHVVRLAHGYPIYVEPSLDFIPLAYMPLFSALAAPLAHVFGPAFWEARLISILSVFGTAALIVRIVRLETRSWTFAAAGAGIYLMGFGITGTCYDVARPDSLMLFLAVAGLATLRTTRGLPGAATAALLLSLAFFTKQHAMWFMFAALVHLALNDRRRFPTFAIGVGLGCVGGYFALSAWLGPWFHFYTFEVPSHWSQISPPRMIAYVGQGLLGSVGLLFGPAILSLSLPQKPWRGPGGLWAWVGLGAVATGLMATLDPWAYLHVFMPTMVAFSILGPISIHRLMTSDGGEAAARAHGVTWAACAVLMIQYVPLIYGTHDRMPHPRAQEAQREFVNNLRRHHGGVLMPYHGFYDWAAGKGSSLHIIALDDIRRARGNSLLKKDPKYFEKMFATLHDGPYRPIIVTDVPLKDSGPLWASLDDVYTLDRQLGWISEPLRPVTGNRFTPEYVYRPRVESTLGARQRRPSEASARQTPHDGPVTLAHVGASTP